MDLNRLRDLAHKNAVEHGFWKKELSDKHCLMLAITEVAEAVEADRKGRHFDTINNDVDNYERINVKQGFEIAFLACIKDTVSDELADVVIRLLDFAGARGIDCYEYGEKKDFVIYGSFTEFCFELCHYIMLVEKNYNYYFLSIAINYIMFYCEREGIDIEFHVNTKMRYNKTREALHGKKY